MVDDDAIARLYAIGRAAWPTVELDREAFGRHLRALTLDEATIAGRAADLYLACACARGDTTATTIFDRQFLGEVPQFIARIDASPAFADEVLSLLREKLLMGKAGAAPRLATYSAKGALGGWVRVAAVRCALDLRAQRVDLPARTDDLAAHVMAARADPELELLRARYQAELQRALESALAALSPKERTVMRLHFVDGLNIEKIGLAHHVHRATVARWLVNSERKLLDETRRLLGERCGLQSAELASLVNLLQSQLHLSLGRLLGPE